MILDSSSYEVTFSRILRITWQENNEKIKSHVALLREHLRRMALWAKVLGCTDEWPFFDVTAYLKTTVEVPPSQMATLRNHLVKFGLSNHIIKTCEWSLCWAKLNETSQPTRFLLPAPYDPLLLMYERGGVFFTEHGFFQIGLASFPRRSWNNYDRQAAIVELDEVMLNQLDLKQAK